MLKNMYTWVERHSRPWISYASHRLQDLYIEKTTNLVLNCIGDSHNAVFAYIQRMNLVPNIYIRCTTVMGATVFGLANPNSKTNALPIFQRELKGISSSQAIGFMLGEIDCGFLIFLRAKNIGTSLETQINESLNRYRSFLSYITTNRESPVVIWSVPPPTIMDHRQLGDIANLRREVTASVRERTSLTCSYNQRLRALAEDLGFQFIDMDPFLLDGTTGIVKKELLNSDPRNHHLKLSSAAPFYAHAISEHIITSR